MPLLGLAEREQGTDEHGALLRHSAWASLRAPYAGGQHRPSHGLSRAPVNPRHDGRARSQPRSAGPILDLRDPVTNSILWADLADVAAVSSEEPSPAPSATPEQSEEAESSSAADSPPAAEQDKRGEAISIILALQVRKQPWLPSGLSWHPHRKLESGSCAGNACWLAVCL